MTLRQRKRGIKQTRHGSRMRPPIKRKPVLRYYDASSIRMFINGVECTNFAQGGHISFVQRR